MSEAEIWRMGGIIGAERAKPPKARADFAALAVTEAGLTIEHDPAPDIPDHVNLCGWPPEKDEQKSIAQILSARSKLFLAPL